ncbi:MAG: hypothetical protein WEB87_02195, partial [Bacteriovoracaceae bacterium]
MKQALKQIFAGFIYSIMTLSFILSPIPNVNVSWAQADVYRMDDVQGYPSGQRSSSGQGNSSGQGSTSGRDCYDPENDSQSDRLYKPGCELNGVVNKASLENYTGHQKSFVAIMEQAVAGMMAVTLIQSLRYSYLHEVEGQTFGNDCGSNVMGKYTLRIAQLGGLSYILGDIKANTAFQRASKKATDTAFGPPTAAPAGENGEPATEFEAAGHKMKQIRAFNALIEVFEGQEKGLKAKRNLSLVTEGAYAASLGLELGGILRCSSQCKKNMGQYWAKKAMLTAALSKASLALTSELAIATNPVTAACKGTSLPPLATALANLKAQYGVNEIDNKASGQANSVRKAAKDEQDGGFWTGILAGIKGFFGGKKTTDADVAAGSQVAEGQVNEVKKVMGIPVESVDQANAKTQGAANSTKISAKATKDDASIMSII